MAAIEKNSMLVQGANQHNSVPDPCWVNGEGGVKRGIRP